MSAEPWDIYMNKNVEVIENGEGIIGKDKLLGDAPERTTFGL
jgi:hypothetical protein